MRASEKILKALGENPRGLSGAELGRATGLVSGFLYPSLLKLERNETIASGWEDENAPYPRRRIYWINAKQG